MKSFNWKPNIRTLNNLFHKKKKQFGFEHKKKNCYERLNRVKRSVNKADKIIKEHFKEHILNKKYLDIYKTFLEERTF
jgi:hypothetical protein